MHLKTYIIPNSWHLKYFSLQTTLRPPTPLFLFPSSFPTSPLIFPHLSSSPSPFYPSLFLSPSRSSLFTSSFHFPRAAVVHLGQPFRSQLVLYLALWTRLAGATRLTRSDSASYRLNLLLSFPVFFLSQPHSF